MLFVSFIKTPLFVITPRSLIFELAESRFCAFFDGLQSVYLQKFFRQEKYKFSGSELLWRTYRHLIDNVQQSFIVTAGSFYFIATVDEKRLFLNRSCSKRSECSRRISILCYTYETLRHPILSSNRISFNWNNLNFFYYKNSLRLTDKIACYIIVSCIVFTKSSHE